MGSLSIWHWIILLILVVLPVVFIVKQPPDGQNRFGDVGHPMGFGQAISAFFSNYFNFSGRASRSEFWWAVLFNSIMGILVSFVPLVDMLWTLITFLPSISLATRRLHDINRSGWLQLLAICFPIGTVAVIVWYCSAPDEVFELAARPAGGATGSADLDRLERLSALRTSGAITDAEFEAQKRLILNS